VDERISVWMVQSMAPIYSAKSTPLDAQKLMKINFN